VLEILKTIVANYEEIQVQQLLKFIICVKGGHCYRFLQAPKKNIATSLLLQASVWLFISID
jgi:hypothetical protein